MVRSDTKATWPALPYEEWRQTAATLHLWLQVVGKIRLALAPWVNHSWHVTMRVSARGLTTPLTPYKSEAFQIELDFIDHRLLIRLTDGRVKALPLEPQTTAAFHAAVMQALADLGMPVAIRTMPSELPDPIPFDLDEVHRSYDPGYANRYWRVLVHAARVFEQFRAGFLGKASPVHFFWGSADLAVTRFSGRSAPFHPGGVPHLPDWVAREAYSHEVSSAGFWAGADQYPRAVFYSYAYPEPADYARATPAPAAAYYDDALREFVLPYDDVRTASAPDAALLEFLESTYEAAARLGEWNRAELERPEGWPRDVYSTLR
ncbi:MAG TPA: DUF5996 family protein [Steroidobacter sp.]